MHTLFGLDLPALVMTFGYAAIFLAVAIESTGIPCPGETVLVLASIYAAATHELSLPWVILAAAGGAVVGDNCGYWLGRLGGYRILARYGRYVHLDERRLKIGQYFFWKHGAKIVFLGRFVAVLRAWAALLAGVNRMSWRQFTLFNVTGGVVWATVFGVGGYVVGENVQQLNLPWPVGVAILVGGLVAFSVVAKRGEARLALAAESAGFVAAEPPRPATAKRGLGWSLLGLTLAAGLAIGILEVWFLTTTSIGADLEQDLFEWGWAVGMANAGRSIATAGVLILIVPALTSLLRRHPFRKT